MRPGLLRFVRQYLVWCTLALLCAFAHAQGASRIQAEDAALSGSLTVRTDLHDYEGSGFVGSFTSSGDLLSLTFPDVVAGYYDIRIRYHSGTQVNTVTVNGTARSETFSDTGDDWAVKTIPSIAMVGGANTITIAKDWGSIEVDYVEISASTAPGASSATHVEAEDGVLAGTLTVLSDVPGYEGSGYVGTFADAADRLSFSFANVVAGLYDIRIRYHSYQQVNTVTINGTDRSEIFPDTAGAWAVRTISRISLVNGTNSISISKDWGWMDIDYLEIVTSTVGSGDSPTHVEAENGTLTGTLAVHGDVPGYQGSGYVGRWSSNTDQLAVSFVGVTAGAYDIRIRYHAWSAQQNIVAVNGTANSESFPATGWGWGIMSISKTLIAGTNTVTISQDWGYIDVDYIEIAPTDGGSPTIAVTRSPATMTAGQSFTLTWNATNATTVTRTCVASGTGFSGNNTMPAVSGSQTGTADQAWVGFPSTCTWTASGSEGSATFTETMTTVAATSAPVRYHYDRLGRLVQVVAPSGQSARYTYDEVGNILAITNTAASAVSISGFTPTAGPTGTNVTINGSGFSTTLANNAVSFNGTAAVVSAATSTSLVVAVPSGAASGSITVANSNGSATSDTAFTVADAGSAPTITSFTPQFGGPGTVVSVSGTNFQTSATLNKATLGGISAAVLTDTSSPVATLLKLAVPNTTSSGKITIATPYGKATSATDFYSLPTTVSSSDVEFTGRLVVDGASLNVFTSTGGKKAVLLFDGAAGQKLHLVSTGGTFASAIAAVVYARDGRQLETFSLGNQSTGHFTDKLDTSGTYTIVLTPQATDMGSISLSLVADRVGVLNVDASTAIVLPSGTRGHYSFTAEAGKGYGLAFPGYATTPNGASMAVTLRKTGGAVLASCNVFNGSSSCTFSPSLFAIAGEYELDFVPNGGAAATFNASLSKDAGGPITIDGTPTTMTVARAGQNGRYTFSGTAGQSVSIVLSNMVGITNTVNVQVYRPSDGAVTGTMNVYSGAGGNLGVSLPETGTYTLLVDPWSPDVGSIDVQVKSYATGTLAVDGTTSVDLSAGRTGRYIFTADAGKGYGLGLPGYSITPSGTLFVTLRKVDGTALHQCNIYGSGGSCSFAPSFFDSSGTYTIDFVPSGTSAVTFDAALSKDSGGALTIDAPAVTMTVARAGQNGRYTFSGTANQSVSIVLSNMVSIANVVNVQLNRPSGPVTSSMNVYNGSGGTLNVTLPETGTYNLLVDPWGLDTGSIDLRVIDN